MPCCGLDLTWIPQGFVCKRLGPQPGGIEMVGPVRNGAQLEAIVGPFSCRSGFQPGHIH